VYKIFLPKPAKPGLPADIRRTIPPTVRASIAKGVATIFTIKLYILPIIVKKSLISQGQLASCPHGTRPFALSPVHAFAWVKIGAEKKLKIINDKKNTQNIFFININYSLYFKTITQKIKYLKSN
jgi:hypothetical protein